MEQQAMQLLERLALRLAPPPDHEFTAPLDGGLKLTLPADFPRARMYAAGVYEDRVTTIFKRVVREGMIVADIGAFCGYYTLLASRLVGNGGHVYAFEPDPRNFSYLQKNIHDNNCTNVTAKQTAVLHATGTAALVPHEKADHHWISFGLRLEPQGSTVVMTTLDEVISAQGWPPVHLIKMDIEGSEQAALVGMKELSRRNPNLSIIMEFDEANLNRAGTSRESISQTLYELGFTLGYIIERSMKPFRVKSGIPRVNTTCNLLLAKS